jgi:hypothetical protein
MFWLCTADECNKGRRNGLLKCEQSLNDKN